MKALERHLYSRIQKERWDNIYVLDDMEFDRYDNLATEYLIARDDNNNVVGVTRTYISSFLEEGELANIPTFYELEYKFGGQREALADIIRYMFLSGCFGWRTIR